MPTKRELEQELKQEKAKVRRLEKELEQRKTGGRPGSTVPHPTEKAAPR